MPLTSNQTKIFDLRSAEYNEIQADTDGSTTHSAGDIVQVEESAGFVLTDVAISTKFAAIIRANKVRALKAAEAIDAGDDIYYDLSAKVVTKVSTSNVLIGVALEDAALGDASLLMSFDGRTKTLV